MKSTFFYLGLALFFTHELDAMANHEWRVMPLLRVLSDPVGESVFIAAHVPVFAIVIAYIASLNPRTRLMARDVASGFLIVHSLLHIAYSGHPAYGFSSTLSSTLIYGAAFFGVVYFVMRRATAGRNSPGDLR